MAAGYIYILINPSMPGLAKVGKTTRDPTDRVAELSSATGVPSPFMLVYQHPVSDCDVAESLVHAELERNGFRTNSSREFFNAPIHVITAIVINIANQIPQCDHPEQPAESEETKAEDPMAVANSLYEMAEAYFRGTNTTIKNEKKALAYYEQAAASGHADAASAAGNRYHHGIGTNKDYEKALEYYTRAIHLGKWWVQADIAELFENAEQKEAAQDHWVEFFSRAIDELMDANKNYNNGIGPLIGIKGSVYCTLVATNLISDVVDRNAISCLAGCLTNGLKFLREATSDPETLALYGMAQKYIDQKWEAQTFLPNQQPVSSYLSIASNEYLAYRSQIEQDKIKNKAERMRYLLEMAEQRKASKGNPPVN